MQIILSFTLNFNQALAGTGPPFEAPVGRGTKEWETEWWRRNSCFWLCGGCLGFCLPDREGAFVLERVQGFENPKCQQDVMIWKLFFLQKRMDYFAEYFSASPLSYQQQPRFKYWSWGGSFKPIKVGLFACAFLTLPSSLQGSFLVVHRAAMHSFATRWRWYLHPSWRNMAFHLTGQVAPPLVVLTVNIFVFSSLLCEIQYMLNC